MGEFAGKIVVVTGGSKGIGRAAVKRFCEEGAHCVIVNRNAQEGQVYAEELKKQGLSASAMAADVGKVSVIKQMIQDILKNHKQIDVLVNAAGVLRRKLALDTTEEDWDYIMDINLKGSYFCSVEAGRHMVERGEGAIVNISSLQSRIVLPERSVYAASKGGIRMFTQGMANEWAQKGVRVNSISPGFVATEMVLSVMNPALEAFIASRTPMGRAATPAEVADLIAYLASSRASYITGVDVPIDGGWTAS
ncbi:MAG: SDR family NAD(P)-dependent oxidoreductase [Negativicutes bacterium]|nr:SDR family NAD(P)-dependent oxidoreductase [Negativicutes bacterium]